MKRKKASVLTAAAMLLTAAWMTGCDSGKTEESSHVAETTALTTALATVYTEAAADAADDNAADKEAATQDNLSFDSYDAFIEAMGAYYPGVVMVAPPQIVSGEWEVTSISLLTSGEAPFYAYSFSAPEGQQLMLTVSHGEQFDSVEDMKAQLEADASVTVEDGYSGSSWIIGKYEGNGMYVLYGLSGDESTYYSLIGAGADGSTLTPAELQELHDTLCL